MNKMTAVVFAALLAAGAAACSSGEQPSPRMDGRVSETCTLFWTYQSRHGIPEYPSYVAAYKADTAEYGHPSTPGYVYSIMPVLQPKVRITARTSVNVGSIEVVFHNKTGAEANHGIRVAVNKVVTDGHSYTAYPAAGLSDPETGDTDVASCTVASWTQRGGT